MAPIQFQSADGTWIGVGSKVWTATERHEPEPGIVTGFDRVADDDAQSDVAVVRVTTSGTITRVCVFADVFGLEPAAWRHYADLMEAEAQAIARRIANLQKDADGMQREAKRIRQEWRA